MTLVYWSQPSSVVLCIQNSEFSIRITSLHGSQPSFVAFASKTATLGPEIQVSIGPRPHLCFFCIQKSDFSIGIGSLYGSQPPSVFLCLHNSDIMTRINSLYGSQTSPFVLCMQNDVIIFRNTSLCGSQPSSVICACKTASFGTELQVSMGPSPHLWFLHSKQQL